MVEGPLGLGFVISLITKRYRGRGQKAKGRYGIFDTNLFRVFGYRLGAGWRRWTQILCPYLPDCDL